MADKFRFCKNAPNFVDDFSDFLLLSLYSVKALSGSCPCDKTLPIKAYHYISRRFRRRLFIVELHLRSKYGVTVYGIC